jgi:hypothetical protein
MEEPMTAYAYTTAEEPMTAYAYTTAVRYVADYYSAPPAWINRAAKAADAGDQELADLFRAEAEAALGFEEGTVSEADAREAFDDLRTAWEAR